MRDEMELLLQTSLKPQLTPPAELNRLILDEVKETTKKSYKFVRKMNTVVKAAIIVLAVFGLATVGVSAGAYIYKNFFVTSVGPVYGTEEQVQDFEGINDEETYYPQVYQICDEAGDDTVKWNRKVTKQNDETTVLNYYYYDKYEDLIEDSKLDQWLPYSLVNDGLWYASMVVITEPGTMYEQFDVGMDVNIKYKDGNVYICQTQARGSDKNPETFGYNVYMENPQNVRNYTNEAGRSFTIVDDVRADGRVDTTTTFFYPQMVYGFITFNDLSDEDIFAILEQFVEPEGSLEEFVFPEKPGVEAITKPVSLEGLVSDGDTADRDGVSGETDNWLVAAINENFNEEDVTVTVSEDTDFVYENWVTSGPGTHIVVEPGVKLYFDGFLSIKGSFSYQPGDVYCSGDTGRYYAQPGSTITRGDMIIKVEGPNEFSIDNYAVEFGITDNGNILDIFGGIDCTIKFSGITREEFNSLVRLDNIFDTTKVFLNDEDITSSLVGINYFIR